MSRIILLLAIACATVHANAASPVSPPIDAVLTAARHKEEFNGVALVARKSRIVHEAAYGTVGAAADLLLDAHYRFNIGSIGKEFSAVAIMKLQEQGRLSLADPIGKVLTDLPQWGSRVNVRNLLDYTSGVPDMSWRTIHSDADAYADIRGYAALQFEPGTQYAYTYNNVMLRQFIVEKLTGLSFNEYLAQRIFKPCGMRDALLNPTAETPRVARAFNEQRKEDPTDMPITGVAFVTAQDLLAWTECLHGGRILDHKSIRSLGQSFNPRNGGLGDTTWEGDRLVMHAHEGQSRNFEALMRSDLGTGITIILLGNNKRDSLQRIADEIARSGF